MAESREFSYLSATISVITKSFRRWAKAAWVKFIVPD
jgi:hypothetical protein